MHENRPVKPRSTKILITATIALGLLVMAAGGGFAYLNHAARTRAKAQIDAFASRLPEGVDFHYAGYDANVLSRVFVMERIRIADRTAPERGVDIGRLEVRDLEVDAAGEPVRYRAELKDLHVDLGPLARDLAGQGISIPAALVGDCRMAYEDDGASGMRGIRDLTADFPGFGSMQMTLQIRSPQSITEMQRLQQAGRADAIVVDDLHVRLDWQDDRFLEQILTGETRDSLLGWIQMADMLAETDPRMADHRENIREIRRFVENPRRLQIRLSAKPGGQGRLGIDSLDAYDLTITAL